jgi:non-ribosomal peptide synthetase component F
LRNIQAWSELVRSQGQSLFESLLIFGNYPLNDLLKDVAEGLEIGNISFLEGSNYPLTLFIDPSEELTIRMVYDTHRFDNTTIVQILKHFQTLLKAFTVNPHQPLSAFALLTAEEMQKLLAKAQSKATDLKEESKVQFNQSMEELRNKKQAAAEKLNELNSASGEAWEDIKSGMDSAMDELNTAFDRARSHFE